jgi:GntR family transcriptional regulator/MocR family aminotransferase
MNAIYAARMAAAVSALRRHCGDWLEVGERAGGLQLATWFRDTSTDDLATVQRINAQGFALRAMSTLHLGPPRPGLLFGIARMPPEAADAAVAKVAAAVSSTKGQ